MVRAKVVRQKLRRPRKSVAKTPQEERPLGFDRAKAFQDAINELRNNADRYMREPDMGSVIRSLLNKVGVPMTDEQANALCGAAGVNGSLRPTDAQGLRSAMGNAAKKMPKGSPTIEDLMKRVNPK